MPATDLFENLSFLLQWNISKLIWKWNGIFEQKILKEKSTLGFFRVSMQMRIQQNSYFCVSSCKYQQSCRSRLSSWNLSGGDDILSQPETLTPIEIFVRSNSLTNTIYTIYILQYNSLYCRNSAKYLQRVNTPEIEHFKVSFYQQETTLPFSWPAPFPLLVQLLSDGIINK